MHTHVVFFNVTERSTGETRALQPQELYKTQQYGTAIYRSELAARLIALGYEVERGTSGQPEIRGYTSAYLEASSPRRQQIQDHLERVQRSGAGAAQIAAHQTREAKGGGSKEEMQRRHDALADTAGLNADVFDALVVLAAGEWAPDAIARGYRAVQDLHHAMDEGRRQRLTRLGFPDDEAAELSALHTRNFM